MQGSQYDQPAYAAGGYASGHSGSAGASGSAYSSSPSIAGSGASFEAYMEEASRNAPAVRPLTPAMPNEPALGERSPALVGDGFVESLAAERGIDLPPRELNEDDFLGMDREPNYGDNLRGVWRDDYSRQSSLLTEPHPMVSAPEGAVDYVGVDGFPPRWYPNEIVTEDFIRRKEAEPYWEPLETQLWDYDG